MSKGILSAKEVNSFTDENGNTTTSIKETTKKIEVSTEPDFIKLYTNMWCEFNQIPMYCRPLFLELVTRMSYADANDLEHSQIVATGGMTKQAICKTLGWGSNMYQKGLKALTEAGAIQKKMRGFYQISPEYAGRGEWKYNPKLARGGVEDLVAVFKFKEHSIEQKILWADDSTDNDLNKEYRKVLNTKASDKTVLKTVKRKPKSKQTQQQESEQLEQIPGQYNITDYEGVVNE